MPNRRSTNSTRPRSSLDSGLHVLELLARSRRHLSLTEIARELGMSKSAIHSLLETLLRRGFVTRTEARGYSLGVKAWEIGSASPAAEIAEVAGPVMAQLAEEIDEGVILGKLDGADVVYLQLVEGPQAVRVHARVGDRIPAHCTSTGLALLATLSVDDVQTLFPARLNAVSPETITTGDELRAELERTRRRGYSINRGGWRADVAGIAVCVTAPSGATIAALCVAVPRYRMNKVWIDRVLPRLSAAAARIGVAAEPQRHAPHTSTTYGALRRGA